MTETRTCARPRLTRAETRLAGSAHARSRSAYRFHPRPPRHDRGHTHESPDLSHVGHTVHQESAFLTGSRPPMPRVSVPFGTTCDPRWRGSGHLARGNRRLAPTHRSEVACSDRPDYHHFISPCCRTQSVLTRPSAMIASAREHVSYGALGGLALRAAVTAWTARSAYSAAASSRVTCRS